MVGNVSTLTAITDVAVCSQAPHHILVATEHGNVHLFADAETPTGIVWGCHGGPLRVGWAGTRAIAWNADPISHQLFILDADGQVRKQHSIPSNCDLAPCNGGFFIATSQARLVHYALARDGSCDREDRHVPAPGSYDAGSLTAANSGTVALRSGGLVQLQTKPSRAWQDVKAGGVAASLSHMGTRLATAWAHEGGAHVHSFVVSDSAVVLETPYAVRALPEVITNLEWSVDESMLVAYARGEGDVRVFFRDGWAPGLWTNSAIRPHFHPSGVISVPKTRDRLIANEPRGAASKTWSRWRETTPATFTVSGAESMRRGDKVVVFEREPRTRPTSIYEIVGAHRKDDDTRGLAHPPVVCRLRLGIAPITDRLLDIDAAALSAIEDSESGEIESSTIRALMDRLLTEQPDTLEQMRMYLATSAAGDPINDHPPTATASTPAKGATAVAPPEGARSLPTPSLPTDPDPALSTSGSTEGRPNRAPSAPLDINRAPESSLVAHVVSERGALDDLPRMAVSQSTAAALRADLIASSGDEPRESDKSRRSPGAHVSLTDRQAADMDAHDVVSELQDKVSRAVASNVGEKAMAFRNAFIDALRELSRRLIEIYVDLDEAFEPTMRDELVTVIEGRVSAFIQSSNATYGHGRYAAC